MRITTAAGGHLGRDRSAQRQVVADMTRLIVDATGDESVAARTFVLHTEAVEGGCGENGTAFTREDFDGMKAKVGASTK